MNGTPARVRIVAPFSAALQLMKKILFRPFDFQKWCVIGFAAFLAHLAGGGGGNFGGGSSWRNGDWKSQVHSASRGTTDSLQHFSMWLVPVIIIVVLLVFAMIAVLLWLGSRGRFIFTDCIARDRGAIKEPWREFRREGNSLFLFSLMVALVSIVVIAVCVVLLLLPALVHGGHFKAGVPFVVGVIVLAFIFVFAAIAWALISQFMVPIMYRRRCRAIEAFRIVSRLILDHLGQFILYLLFIIALGIASLLIACLATCVTCCVASIPYVGTVLLLPLYVTLAAYPLLFLRQFGPDYDVWTNEATASISESPTQAAPIVPPPFPL